MFFEKKKSKIKVNEFENEIKIVAKEEPVEQPKIEDEWIWVEGYKGTDKNMKCRDYQYELNKHYTCIDEVKLCEKGFHFCTKLEDVFRYYNLSNEHRYFKVKGLVKKSDYEKTKSTTISIHYRFGTIDSKIVAKEIIFLDELSFEDLKQYIILYYPMIETEEEYYNYDNDYNNYIEFCRNKFLSEMNILGFSELYSNIKCNKLEEHRNLYVFLQRARAYKAEGINKDVMIYLLETIN